MGAPYGNQNAKGHGAPKGNQNGKGHGAPYGNRNAMKFGFYSRVLYHLHYDQEADRLFLLRNGQSIAEIGREEFYIDGDNIYCSPEAVKLLKKFGLAFE